MGKFNLKTVLDMQENNCSIDEILSKIEYKSISTLKGQMKKNGYILKDNKFIPGEANTNKNNELETILKELKEIKDHIVQDKKVLSVSSEAVDLKAFSIRVNKSDLDAFNELCNEYQHISKSYLFSLALREFAEKYSK